MKKLCNILFLILILSSCEKDSEIETLLRPSELIAGEWIYDDPQSGIWEEQNLLNNMKLYYSAFCLNPYVLIENAEGSYYFTEEDKKMTLVYTNIMGGLTQSDVEIENINNYSYTGKFTNSDGTYGGKYIYHRLMDRIKLSLKKSVQPNYRNYITNADILSYSSNDTSIISVDSKTGNITAAGNTGQTYVNIQTTSGDAYVEVIVDDPDNLFPDYSSALNMNYLEVKEKWGNYNKQYSNNMRYPIRGNQYAKMALIWLNKSKNVESVQMELKEPISLSTTEKEIHKFLSTKYEYQSKKDGVYMYFDFSQPDILPMAIYYSPSQNLVEYQKIS